VNFDKLIVKPPKLNMRNLRKSDNDTCQITKKRFKPSEMSMEHIVPESKGGKKVWPNIALVHREVNSMRGNRPYNEVGLTAPRAFTPRGRKPEESIEPLFPEWVMFLRR
jgi:5-methylcytosine-specific restriction endonuclease McrA